MKILAIDDQKLVLIPLEVRLKELGYEIITETSAKKGLELFDSFKPDLVIVDINMPETSGIEVVKYIREKRKSDTPNMQKPTLETFFFTRRPRGQSYISVAERSL